MASAVPPKLLQRHAAFEDGDAPAVVLFAFGFFARGVFDDRVEEAFSCIGDGFALGDGTCVKVNPAGFMFVKAVVGGDFDCGRGSAEGSSPACGEEDEVRAGSR